MATERLSMRQTREILRQKWRLGRTHREVAQSLGISCGAVGTTVLRARAAGLAWAQVEALDDEALHARVYGPPTPPTRHRPLPDCAYLHAERRKPGVTLELLHLEYLEQHPDGYRYTQFCEVYRRWLHRRGLSMRQVHRGRPEADDDRGDHRRGDHGRALRRGAGRLELHLRGSDAHPAGPGLGREPPAGLPVLWRRHRGHRARSAQERRRGAVPLRAGPAADLRRIRAALRHGHPARAAGEAPGQGEDRSRRPGRGAVDPGPPPPRDLLLARDAQCPDRRTPRGSQRATDAALPRQPRRPLRAAGPARASATPRRGLRLQRLEGRRSRQHRLPHRAPRSLLLCPLRAHSRTCRRTPDRDHRRDLLPRPARRRASAEVRPRPAHHRPRPHAEGPPAPPRVDAVAPHRLGAHDRRANGRAGRGDPRGPSASRAGLSLVPRHLAARQGLRPRAAGSSQHPRRRGRGALLSSRRLDPQARPRPSHAARGLAAAHPHARPRTRAWPGLLPVKGAPMLTAPTLEQLHALKLAAMAAAWTEQQHQADMTALAFDERFGLLVEAEWLARENKRLTRALQEAKLKLSQACLEAIDYPARRELDKAVIRQLATCRWVEEHHNVILVGATGVGKSFLACALAHQACRKGYRAGYRRASRLFHELALARADGTYVRLLAKLARLDVLIVDDWGLAPVQDPERRDFLEILEDRYGTHSTIITSQLPPAQWHDYLGEATLADAICDRLLHNAHRIVLQGPSRRKEAKLEG